MLLLLLLLLLSCIADVRLVYVPTPLELVTGGKLVLAGHGSCKPIREQPG